MSIYVSIGVVVVVFTDVRDDQLVNPAGVNGEKDRLSEKEQMGFGRFCSC